MTPKKNLNGKAAAEQTAVIKDRPAASLLKSWGKRMSQGAVAPIPVFIGGSWSLAVPRGNKRILQLPVDMPRG